MNTTPPKRAPGAVWVVATLWFIACGFFLLYGLALVLLFGVLSHVGSGGPPPPAPEGARWIEWAFDHYLIAGGALVALGLLGAFCGLRFVRLETWARGALELGGWAGVGVALLIGHWHSGLWGPGPHEARYLIGGVLNAAFFAVLPATFVGLLRSSWIRPAFHSDASRGRALGAP